MAFSGLTADFLANPRVDRAWDYGPDERAILSVAAGREALAAIAAWPGYAPTPLRDLGSMAAEALVQQVLYKDESLRFGLKSFKALGGAYAVERLAHVAAGKTLTVTCATDGNHGRAVAWGAQRAGARAVIYVHEGVSRGRAQAIAALGAEVVRAGRTYDDSVRLCAAAATANGCHIVSDTSWPGYEDVPRWVVEGYETIFSEADEQLGGAVPDVALIPVGVGSLAVAAAHHWPADPPRLVGLEPETAACALASIRAGEPVTVPGPHTSIMAGLNAGTVSKLAWPVLRNRFDAFCAIDDTYAERGMRALAELGVKAGEVSGGTVGAALAICSHDEARAALRMDAETTLFLLLTEGVTDPASWARIVGRQP
jgi:diaminopropionate ammonia-lyase